MNEERRRDDVRIGEIEKQVTEALRSLELLKAHLTSELGGNGTVGNVHYRLSELKTLMTDHQIKFDKLMVDNGKPGLPTRVRELETLCKDVPEMGKSIVDIKLSMAKWIGGGAVIMVLGQYVIQLIIKV